MIAVERLKDRSIRNMGNVLIEVREKALQLIDLAYREGILVQISSGFRSLEEQAVLYGQGRPDYVWKGRNYGRNGRIVTYAQPGQSNHNDGRAIDFFLVSPDGNKALWSVDENWRRVAELAKSLGFSWGGDWKSFTDFPHLELPRAHQPVGIIKRGDTGSQVEGIQQKLAQLGYSLGKYGVDGSFGAVTEAAIRKFQSDRGIKVDGIIGPETLGELNNSKYPGKPLKIPAKGVRVKRIQRKVGVFVDGHFGKKTEAAVRNYQQRHHLKMDGIVGPETWNHMFG